MNRRVLPLIIGSLLLPLGCGGNDEPTGPTGPSFSTLSVTTASLPNAVPTVKSRVVCKSERKLLDASVRLPWRPPSVREA